MYTQRYRAFVLTLGLAIAIGSGLLVTPAQAHEGEEQAHKDIIRRLITEVFNKGNMTVLDEVYAPNYEQTDPAGRKLDLKTVKGSITRQRQAVPDVQATIIQLLAEGDWVAGRAYFAGTFKNDFTAGTGQKIPATGKPVMYMASMMYRFNDKDQIVEEIFVREELSIYRQLGVVPMPKNGPAMQPMAAKDLIEIQAKDMPADMVAAAKKGVIRVADEAFTQGKVEVLDDILDKSYMEYDNDDLPFGVTGFKAQIKALREALPDLTAIADPIVVEGDWAAFVFKIGGTFKKSLLSPDGQNIAPTGKPLQSLSIGFIHYNEKGQATEAYLRSDNFSFLIQAGVIKP
jgi:predicted ester cyclase